MTLDTRIYVVDEIDLRELFTKCQSLLTQYDEQGRAPEQQRSKMYPGSLDNEPMQDLPAWLMVHHGGERPHRTAGDGWKYAEPGDPVCTETEHSPVCWYEVSYDTAYGYRGPDGMGCGDLHARLIAELGAWLDGKGVRWKWQNEFTGEVHEGYDRLIELASGGFEATSWFQTTVVPAITARIGGAK
jgi:hypothetical protein